MRFEQSRRLQERAVAAIPGGCHTYAKGEDQYPEPMPGIIVRGKGCHVWDADGNCFIEYGMGLRSVTLGHAYEPVVNAAREHMLLGSNYTRPAKIEIDCAELLLGLIDGAEQVKFEKDGSTVTTAAIKVARAVTGRDHVAICAQNPFLSYDDWFFSTTQMPAGVPQAIRELSHTFHYNDISSLEAVFDAYPQQIAAVIMEPERDIPAETGYLQSVLDLCNSRGALLVFDEMITGFRWHLGGAQGMYGVTPHLSTFGKALANGFSVSALLGKREFMDVGSLDYQGERVFLLSTTHGAENHSLAAAIGTMEIYRDERVVEQLDAQGRKLRERLEPVVRDSGVGNSFEVIGKNCNLVFATRDEDGKPSQPFRTLFLQEMMKSNVLCPSFVVAISHTDEVIDQTVDAVASALDVYVRALNDGIDSHLVGRPVKPAIRPHC